jgi:hypothetical protein
MMMKKKKAKCESNIWEQIELAQKNPEFIRAVYEFVRESTKSNI